MRTVIFTILCLALLIFSSSRPVSKVYFDINLSHIRNSEGVFYIFIYTYKNQYPYEPYKHYKVAKNKVKNGKLTARINHIELPKQLAVALIDDENNNEDLDRWLGLPTEGYGFSNNIKPLFSLPDYEDLLINLSPNNTIHIKIQYLL